MMLVEWRDVGVTPYQVSNFGDVRRDGRVLKNRRHSSGYTRICTSINGVHKDEYVHRLVCFAYLGEPPTEEHQVDHIDSDRANNHVKNLRWVLPDENKLRRTFAKGENNGASKLTNDDAIRIKGMISGGESDADIAKVYSVSRRTIRDIRNGKNWGHL